jgi:hypothetical protein
VKKQKRKRRKTKKEILPGPAQLSQWGVLDGISPAMSQVRISVIISTFTRYYGENTQENLRTPLPQIPPSTNYLEPFVISTQDAVNALN